MNNEMFVPHPEMAITIRAISQRMKRCLVENKGAAMFVEVPSGAGKTTLVRFFKAAMPDQISDEETKVRVVAFSVPKVITLKQMDKALLAALGDPKAGSGTHYDLDKRSISLLRTAGTELILIDNIQDIPEKRRAGGILQIGNWIRDLIDDSRRLVVLLGTQDSRAILQSNIQLMRRCPAKRAIAYFNPLAPAGLSRLGRFLREIDERLPLAELSGLGDKGNDTTHQFAYATGGIHDYIFQILSAAVCRAVTEGREKLSTEDLAAGYEETFQELSQGINPFRGEAKRILDQEGEPLHGLLSAPTPKNGRKSGTSN
jgi:energy-coupling factor transporter ATP-binding protein EcfA2